METKQNQAFIYQVDGEIVPVMPKDGKFFSLKELQDIVKGYIEIVYLEDGRLMVVNEEGKIDGLHPNIQASYLYGLDYIVGNALVTPKEYID